MEVRFLDEVHKYVGVSTTVVIVILSVLLFVKYYDKIKLILSDIWLYLAFFISWLQRKAIKTNIEARATIVIKDIDRLCPELMLPSMSISWVKEEDVDSLFDADKDQTIVMVRYNRDNSQNVINAVMAYVKKSLLPTARPYIEGKLMSAIDYSFILKFLEKSEHHDVLVSKYVTDNKDDVLNNSESITCIKSIDDVGLFSRILLREFSIFGARVLGLPLHKSYADESLELVC